MIDFKITKQKLLEKNLKKLEKKPLIHLVLVDLSIGFEVGLSAWDYERISFDVDWLGLFFIYIYIVVIY